MTGVATIRDKGNRLDVERLSEFRNPYYERDDLFKVFGILFKVKNVNSSAFLLFLYKETLQVY